MDQNPYKPEAVKFPDLRRGFIFVDITEKVDAAGAENRLPAA